MSKGLCQNGDLQVVRKEPAKSSVSSHLCRRSHSSERISLLRSNRRRSFSQGTDVIPAVPGSGLWRWSAWEPQLS